MADQTVVKFLYPPNFTGTFFEDAKSGYRRYVVLCTCVSDDTGEDDAIKVKRTDLLTSAGETPVKLIVEKIKYGISGMAVTISYNNVNNEVIAELKASEGELDFTDVGGFAPEAEDSGEGGGDIVFTTTPAASGDKYNIELTVRVK